MSDMRRWDWDYNGMDEDPYGEYVLAADAEAAIAAAERKGGPEHIDAMLNRAYEEGSDKGQRDMLARCIAAVEEIIPDDSDSGSWELTIAAAWLRHVVSKLRELEDKS